jgi:hypothetical protein
VGVDEPANELPQVYALQQNYPNPFNPSTTISYDVPKASNVKVVIFDVLGREVATLINGVQPAGRYNAVWNASRMATGMYVYRMEAQAVDGSGSFNAVKKLILMK